MLFVNNRDKPGFIGALGTLLGECHAEFARRDNQFRMV